MEMWLNKNKAKCIATAKEENVHMCDTLASNKPIAQTQHFRYLESIFPEDGRCSNTIKSRIVQGKRFL